VNLNVGGGVGEVVDGALQAPAIHTVLEGRVSLADRSLAMRAQVNPGPPGTVTPTAPIVEFNLTGSWDDVDVIPDAKALIERSGAAKRLLGLDRLPTGALDASAAPMSTIP
jgi:AsmA protein